MRKSLLIDTGDHVAVALQDLEEGDQIAIGGATLELRDPVPSGHKFAIRDLDAGDLVLKYGYPIGEAFRPIRRGEHVHTHNLRTRLGFARTDDFSPHQARYIRAAIIPNAGPFPGVESA